MADSKISALTSYSNPDPVNDVFPIVDTANSTTKKISRNNFLGITSTPVGINDSQTLTAKTLTSPTISSAILSGTITGTYTFGGTPTFPAAVATLTGTQTLTNKTLTSPTINTPTITNASVTQDAVTGFTTANSGTVYGVAVTAGAISGASITTGTVGATALSTSAITLGYAQITANPTNISTTAAAQIAGLTTTVTIPTGGRRIEITAFIPFVQAGATQNVGISIWDGVVSSGTKLSEQDFTITSGSVAGFYVSAIVTPAAGSKTYNVGGGVSTNAATINAAATYPAYILVKAI